MPTMDKLIFLFTFYSIFRENICAGNAHLEKIAHFLQMANVRPSDIRFQRLKVMEIDFSQLAKDRKTF
jgi:hypothetical protein